MTIDKNFSEDFPSDFYSSLLAIGGAFSHLQASHSVQAYSVDNFQLEPLYQTLSGNFLIFLGNSYSPIRERVLHA